MKKILFATTALVASAGFAAADVSVSGSAVAGLYADTAQAGADRDGVYGRMSVTVTGSGESDNGVSFGASMTAHAGEDYDTGDFEYDGAEAGTFSLGVVHVSTGGLKISIDQDGIDDLSDDANAHDIQVDYSMGDFSLSVTNDVDGDNGAGSSSSWSISYSAGALSASASGNDVADSTAVNLSYAVSDALSVGVHLDQNGGDQETELQVNYTAGAIAIDADYNMFETADDDWDLGITYSEGAMSISASTDENDAWEISGSYDMGGGMSAVGGVNADDDYYLGVSLSF